MGSPHGGNGADGPQLVSVRKSIDAAEDAKRRMARSVLRWIDEGASLEDVRERLERYRKMVEVSGA